ncbi:SO_0444 family Cu/Zn efflux transporter [bacterium]|nr:SO_0444 family Cu/Zn efflux transporter [bacterium]
MWQFINVLFLNFWDVLGEMSPYLLFGFFVAGLLSVCISPVFIQTHLGRNSIGSIIKASLFGVPLPLCSCGVIPVSVSLRKHGASKGATTAFLISTPQTGVDSILVTLSLLGPVFALFRPILAFVSGIIGGVFVNLTDKENGYLDLKVDKCNAQCCAGKGEKSLINRIFHYGFIVLPKDLAGSLLVGLIIAAAISSLLPKDLFTGMWSTGIQTKLLVMLLGIPLYVCATASVPIAWSLLAIGISPGAALIFLMTGPATNAATLVTMWKVIGKKATVIYLLTVALTALAGGIILDKIYSFTGYATAETTMWMMPDSVKSLSAAILISLMVYLFISNKMSNKKEHIGEKKDDGLRLNVSGMTCSHCAQLIKNELFSIDAVDSVTVNIDKKEVVITGKNINLDMVCEKINELGYSAVKKN